MNQREAMEHYGVKGTQKWAKWVKEGLPRSPRGRGYAYDADDIDAWLAEQQTSADRDKALDLDGDQDWKSLWEKERALKTGVQHEAAALRLAEERGEMVRAADVSDTMTRAATRLRARLLQLGPSLAARVHAATSEHEAEQIITRDVQSMLDELSKLTSDLVTATTDETTEG